MPGYIVAVTGDITDPEAYAQYLERAPTTVEQYGGKVIVGGYPVEQLEGTWQPDAAIFVLEFESVDRARAWYHSPEYTAARQFRLGAVPVHQVLVQPAEAS